MRLELKKAILNYMIENINCFNLLNQTVEHFRCYIYDKDGEHLIGGSAVYEFIKDAEFLLKEEL